MAAAYILITLNISVDFPETLSRLRQIPGVQAAHLVVGPTDCIAYVEADSDQKVLELVKTIRAVDGVEKTDTRLVAEL